MRYEKLGCAGQGGHCGDDGCPICYTFGNTRGSDGGNAGTVSLADAQLLLFPVYSMTGPVWVTTKTRLAEAGFAVTSPDVNREHFATTLAGWNKPINVGWLLLDHQSGEVIVTAPNGVNLTNWQDVAGRLVLVEEGMFSHIVNSNLEVRTSVSIDPVTGAAKKGLLFTYEALPQLPGCGAMWLRMITEEEITRGPFTRKATTPR